MPGSQSTSEKDELEEIQYFKQSVDYLKQHCSGNKLWATNSS